MKKIALLLCFCLLLPLSGCGIQKYSAYDYAFDTDVTLVAYCGSQREFDRLKTVAFDRLEELHRKFDIYHAYDGMTNLYTINQAAGKEAVAADADILAMLLFSQKIYQDTGGLVNVAMGSVLRLWQSARETGALPDSQALQAAGQHCDFSQLVIDADAGTVYLADSQMSLDVGAIAKGWAAQQVAQALTDGGYSNFVLSAGGNVVTRGQAAGQRDWRVGIRNPLSEDAAAVITTLEVAEAAVVTSGGYERNLVVEGKTYCHIIDPTTLYPVDKMLSATVVCGDSALGDGLSTALFLMEPQDALAFAKKMGVRVILVDLSGNLLDSEQS